jgi:hypothetical protein
MLNWLRENDRQTSDRKLRLFACACCRQVWHLLTDERSRKAVEVAERYADGQATKKELSTAWHDCALSGSRGVLEATRHVVGGYAAVDVVCNVLATLKDDDSPTIQADLLRDIVGNPFPSRMIYRRSIHRLWQTNGHGHPGSNEWEEVSWLTPTVLALAEAAYRERGRKWSGMVEGEMGPEFQSGTIEDGTIDPQRLAILADALEDAGCPSGRCDKCGGIGCLECPGRGFIDAGSIVGHLRSPGPHVKGCWVLDLLLGKE